MAIALDGLSTGFFEGKARRILHADLKGTLAAGEFTVLVGPNGAGKSTLLRTLSGLQAPMAGAVTLDAEDIHQMAPRTRARKLAIVLTQQIKTWGVTARQLVALGRHPHTGPMGTLGRRDHEAIDHALVATGSNDLAHRQIAELSDGERQRVMVARALAQEPRVMVLDEVTAFLDLPHRVDILLMLRRLTRQTGCALLLSTHDLDLAMKTADRLWVVKPGGRFAAGTPAELTSNGVFDDLFPGDGLVFDRERAEFRLRDLPA